MQSRSPALFTTWSLTACLITACAGTVSDPEPETDPLPIPIGDPGAPATNEPGASTKPPEAPATALDPGRVTLRRLTRVEYNNTVRDLLGSKLRPADAFAADPVGLGFDNNGDVQTLTTSSIEQYEAAAAALIEEAFAAGGLGTIAGAGRRPLCELATTGCFDYLVGGFARRAWRRPITADELSRLGDLGARARASGADATAALKTVLTAVLMAPHFLFRAETETEGAAAHALSDHELASRLSYLVYGSMPDDALFAAAAAGDLRSRRGVEQQIDRMLGDGKAVGFVENFAGQWLDVRELDSHDVDPKLFPEFDARLRDAMKNETFRFFRHFLADGINVGELLTARFSFVDPLLARHYGMTGSATGGLAPLTTRERGGLLTQAAVLTATSAPNETNPVARGNWVLTKLLCAPPPPPPPDVPPPPEAAPNGTTARARFEAHRNDPVCASCHRLMDPLGFGLEHYDAIGRYRTTDNGGKVDARGELPDGTTFDGALELSAILAKDTAFGRCLARNLFIYAFGRDPHERREDGRFLDEVIAQAESGGGGVNLKRLIASVATSDAFRLRATEGFLAPQKEGARP